MKTIKSVIASFGHFLQLRTLHPGHFMLYNPARRDCHVTSFLVMTDKAVFLVAKW